MPYCLVKGAADLDPWKKHSIFRLIPLIYAEYNREVEAIKWEHSRGISDTFIRQAEALTSANERSECEGEGLSTTGEREMNNAAPPLHPNPFVWP